MNVSFQSIKLFGLALLATSFMLVGCGDSNNDFVRTGFVPGGPVIEPTSTPAPPPTAAPSAVNDSYSSIGNALLRVTAVDGVLNNDTLNGGQISAFDAASTSGGTVSLQADGSFEYTPPNNTTGITDTFTYTLANALGSSTATVSISLNNLGRYVDNRAAPGGDGTMGAPFNTIQGAIDASGSGDTVFVNFSTSPYIESLVLANGVTVQGEGSGFSINNGLAREIRASVVQVEGQAPILQGNATMASNSSLTGMQILPDPAVSAVVAMNVNDITVSDNLVLGSLNGLELTEVGGNIVVERNQFLSIISNGVSLSNTNATANLAFNGNIFSNTTTLLSEKMIFAESSSGALNLSADGNVATGDAPTFTGYDTFVEFNCMGSGSESSSLTLTNNNIFALNTGVNADWEFSGNFEARGNDFSAGACGLDVDSAGAGLNPFRSIFGGPNVADGNTFNAPNGSGRFVAKAAGQESQIVCQNNRLNAPFVVVSMRAGRGSYVVSDNDLTNTGNEANLNISVEDSTGTAAIACRNNVLPNIGNLFVVNSDLDTCAVITGNTAPSITVNENGTGELSVEGLDAPQGGPLTTLNNGSPVTELGTPTSVNVGSCGI